MLTSLFSKLKSTVSRDKQRYQDGLFDLDLTFVTERCVAMAYPAAAGSVESTYRNSIADVAALLDAKCGAGRCLVINVSQRRYDAAPFSGPVSDEFGFPDHHNPPLALLWRAVRAMHAHLAADARNVVAVHCLAGKGRTGTLLIAFFLHARLFKTVDGASTFFAAKRSANHWGVTGPSQQRYVRYTHRLLERPALRPPRALYVLRRVELLPPPSDMALQLSLTVAADNNERVLHRSTQEAPVEPSGGDRIVLSVEHDMLVVSNDIIITIKNKGLVRTESLIRCGFHVGLEALAVDERSRKSGEPQRADDDKDNDNDGGGGSGERRRPAPVVTLRFGKSELDGVVGDKRFANDFEMRVVLHATRRNTQSVLVTSQSAADDDDSDSGALALSFHDCGPVPQDSPRAAESPRAVMSRSAVADDDLYSWRMPLPANGVEGGICFFDGDDLAAKVAAAHRTVQHAGEAVTEKGGWLTKRGHVHKSWKRRWFSLDDGVLRYFAAPSQRTPKGVIRVRDIWAVRRIDSDVEHDNDADTTAAAQQVRGNLFELVTPGRNYLLSAPNEAVREEWIETLEAAAATDAPPSKPVIATLHCHMKQIRALVVDTASGAVANDKIYFVQQFGRQRHRSTAPVTFDVHDDLNELPCLSLSVWAEQQYSADVCLGEALVPLRLLPTGPLEQDVWHDLRSQNGRVRGAVQASAHLVVVPGAGAALLRNIQPLDGAPTAASRSVSTPQLSARATELRKQREAAADAAAASTATTATSTSVTVTAAPAAAAAPAPSPLGAAGSSGALQAPPASAERLRNVSLPPPNVQTDSLPSLPSLVFGEGDSDDDGGDDADGALPPDVIVVPSPAPTPPPKTEDDRARTFE